MDELEIYKKALEDDATDLWNVTNEIRKEIKRREWICEGRGPYSYDDDEYRKETRWAFDAIEALLDGVQRPASNRFHKIIEDARNKQNDNKPKQSRVSRSLFGEVK